MGFPLWCEIHPPHLEEAVSTVENHIAELCENLVAKDISELKSREAEFSSMKERYQNQVQILEQELTPLLEAEFERTPDSFKIYMQPVRDAIEDNLAHLAERSRFMILREKMMRIEFLQRAPGQAGQPEMEYPTRNIKIGACSENITVSKEQVSTRRQEFQKYLSLGFGIHSPATIAWLDQQTCIARIPKGLADDAQRTNLEKLAGRYMNTLDRFRWLRESKGVLVLGCDLRRNNQRMAWSHASYLLARYTRGTEHWQAPGHPTWVLRHYAGWRHTDKNPDKTQMLSGVTGLMRSLCQQLIYSEVNFTFEFLDTTSQRDVELLQEGDHQLLCGLFRELLIDAVNDSRAGGHIRNIVVTIDGIEWLEGDERAAFFYVIDFFRALTDEMSHADWGKEVIFKYILVHPGFSELLVKPHPRELIELFTFEEPAVRHKQIKDELKAKAEQAKREKAKAEKAQRQQAEAEKAKAEKSIARKGREGRSRQD